MHPLTVLSLAEQNLYQDYVLALEAAISAGVLVSDIYAATTALVLDSDVLTAVSDQDLTFGAQTSTVSMATVIMVSDMESPFSAHSEITIQGQPFIYTETNEVYLKLRDDVSPASALGLLIRNTDTDLDTLAELLQRDRLRRESIRNRKPLR